MKDFALQEEKVEIEPLYNHPSIYIYIYIAASVQETFIRGRGGGGVAVAGQAGVRLRPGWRPPASLLH